jgi:hypothetical protein
MPAWAFVVYDSNLLLLDLFLSFSLSLSLSLSFSLSLSYAVGWMHDGGSGESCKSDT